MHERAIRAVSERTTAADEIVDGALDAGLDGSHPVTEQMKMFRLELLNVKADLERELERRVLDCTRWVRPSSGSRETNPVIGCTRNPRPPSRTERLTRAVRSEDVRLPRACQLARHIRLRRPLQQGP
jgi:hypothetical protein